MDDLVSPVLVILKEEGIDTSPQRDERLWTDFIKQHADTYWGSGFASSIHSLS